MNLHKLTTRADVNALLANLRELVVDGILTSEQVAEGRAKLEALQTQLRTGDYIVVEADLSGWGFVSTHYDPDTDRERNYGHTSRQSVVELAQRVGLPVVIGDTVDERRADWLARTLRDEGIVAVIGEDED